MITLKTLARKSRLVQETVINGGSITFKNFTATTFYINNDTYTINNGKFNKQ